VHLEHLQERLFLSSSSISRVIFVFSNFSVSDATVFNKVSGLASKFCSSFGFTGLRTLTKSSNFLSTLFLCSNFLEINLKMQYLDGSTYQRNLIFNFSKSLSVSDAQLGGMVINHPYHKLLHRVTSIKQSNLTIIHHRISM